jgi:DNA-binding HxlR family transcriptional regulator/putative sterol carrier protein
VGSRRGYGEGCAVAHALELVGERWALLVVRELLLGPKRFGALQAGLRQASANIVSQRLQQLQQDGVVQRRRLGPPTNTWVWELTDWGYQLEPIVMAIGDWARGSPRLDRHGWFSPDALALHLKARLSRTADAPVGRYQLLSDDNTYRIMVEPESVRVVRGQLADADATVTADLQTLIAVVTGREPLNTAIADGRLVIQGDLGSAGRLLTGGRAAPVQDARR